MTQSAATGPNSNETPADRRRQRVRDQIIEAAEQLFAREGAGGLSMRRLAEQIDYSPAAIYTYFSSKEVLISAIREQFFERLLVRLDDVAANHEGGGKFRSCLRSYIECALEKPNHYRMAFECHDQSESASDEHGQNTYLAAQRLERMIADNMASGRFRAVRSDLAAASVWSALHGLAMLLADDHILNWPDGGDDPCGGVELDTPDLIDFHVDHIERGLLAPEIESI